jgi:hypothetical protein
MISARYTLSIPLLDGGGADTASANYRIEAGTLGQNLSGNSQSSGYRNAGGFADPARPAPSGAAGNLAEAYVYPNPFKPNSPGSFQADKLTFKRLPPEADIKIFAITGAKVAEFRKSDPAADHYEWDVTNTDGRKLASGVYIYFITAPGGGKVKGKFAVIR